MKYPYDIIRKKELSPTPTYEYNFGDMVEIDKCYDAIVTRASRDRKVYEISYSEGYEKDGKLILTNTGLKKLVMWYEIRTPSKERKSLSERDIVVPKFESRNIQDLIDRMLYFGCNFDTDYRKEHTWIKKQKKLYIVSVFDKSELGSFKLLSTNADLMYECIDGAERMKTLLEFYTDNFSWNGKTFSNLTPKDRKFFLDRMVYVADFEPKTNKEEVERQYKISNRERLKI